jgi:hypothetical protein
LALFTFSGGQKRGDLLGPEIKLLAAKQDRNLFLSHLPVNENRASFWNSVCIFLNKINEIVGKRRRDSF